MVCACLNMLVVVCTSVPSNLGVTLQKVRQEVALVNGSDSLWKLVLFWWYYFPPPIPLTSGITVCGLFFLPREMLRHGLGEISDLVKSLLPKLDHFNSSGWPLNETPPLVIHRSLSTFMIFRNIICHSFYLHRASFKLLKMWVIFLQPLTITHHGTGCSENQLWKPGLEREGSSECVPATMSYRFLNSGPWICHCSGTRSYTWKWLLWSVR
jgi:hypothetical protein